MDVRVERDFFMLWGKYNVYLVKCWGHPNLEVVVV